MSTIKVLHVIARMNVGGTARYVGDLVENIPNSALATGFVQGSEIEDPILSRLDVHRIPHMGRRISPINDFKSWLELSKLVRETKPEIIHTHTFKAGIIGRLVHGNHRRVHTFHGHLFHDNSFSHREKKIITLAERYLAKRTDVLISVGKKVGVELRVAGIGTNKEWFSIAPGVTALPKLDKRTARKSLNLQENSLIIGWMARMTGVKNPLLLLSVAREMPNFNFAMAGGGELLEEVRSSAPPNVTVLGWSDASVFWSAVDCAISTSDNEGMPIALIEAQLAGLPAIATDVGSNAEVVQNGITGVIVDREVQSFVNGLQTMISDQTLFESMATEAETYSQIEFDLAKMLKGHIKIYANLTN